MHSQTEPSARQRFGAPLADFQLPEVRGGERQLSTLVSGFRGGVVVFWSSVCSHCVRYDPYLTGFADRHPRLALVAVAAREGERASELARAAAERGLGFPILHDRERTIARSWRVRQTPRVFLVGPGLELVYRGAIDNFTYPEDPEHEPYLEDAIAAHLAGRELPRRETPSFGCPVSSVFYRHAGAPGG